MGHLTNLSNLNPSCFELGWVWVWFWQFGLKAHKYRWKILKFFALLSSLKPLVLDSTKKNRQNSKRIQAGLHYWGFLLTLYFLNNPPFQWRNLSIAQNSQNLHWKLQLVFIYCPWKWNLLLYISILKCCHLNWVDIMWLYQPFLYIFLCMRLYQPFHISSLYELFLPRLYILCLPIIITPLIFIGTFVFWAWIIRIFVVSSAVLAGW